MIFHTGAPQRIKRKPPVFAIIAFIRFEKNNRLNRHRGGAAPINPQRPFFPSIIARLPFHTSGSRLPFARRIAPRRQLCAVLFTFDPPSPAVHPSLADLTPVCPGTNGNPCSCLSVVSFILLPPRLPLTPQNRSLLCHLAYPRIIPRAKNQHLEREFGGERGSFISRSGLVRRKADCRLQD
jgi:hypothetical protein